MRPVRARQASRDEGRSAGDYIPAPSCNLEVTPQGDPRTTLSAPCKPRRQAFPWVGRSCPPASPRAARLRGFPCWEKGRMYRVLNPSPVWERGRGEGMTLLEKAEPSPSIPLPNRRGRVLLPSWAGLIRPSTRTQAKQKRRGWPRQARP